MRTPCVDAALAELQRAGIRDVEVARGTKHPQVRFRINGGPLHVFAVSGTPSDWRSAENTRRDLRRLLRELGVSAEPERPEPSPPRPEPKPDRISELERRVAALEEFCSIIQTRGACHGSRQESE